MIENIYRDYYEYLESEPPEKRPTTTKAFKEALALALNLIRISLHYYCRPSRASNLSRTPDQFKRILGNTHGKTPRS